jgi:hypothetical protein
LCKDLHNHTSFKNVTVSIAEKRGRKATHLKIAYQHVSDIYKQEQRELDAEEKRLESGDKFVSQIIVRNEQPEGRGAKRASYA